jgi:hypothetical protein
MDPSPADDVHASDEPVRVLTADGWVFTYFGPDAHARMQGVGPAWLDPAPAGGELLKENQLRRVYRLEAPGGALIVKAHALRGIVAAAKAALWGDPAAREARAARYAQAHGVPVAGILAVAIRWRGVAHCDVVSASAELPDVHQLSAVFESWAEAGWSPEAPAALGRAEGKLAALDQAGSELTALGRAKSELATLGQAKSDLTAQGHAESELTALGQAKSELTAQGHAESELAALGQAKSELTPQGHAEWELATPDHAESELAALGRAVGELLAQSHNVGFLHPDNHPGNILVRHEADGWKCWYVDVYGSRCGRPVDLHEAAGSLAQLHQWFLQRTSRSTRLRVLKHYAALRGLTEPRAWRSLARLVAAAATPHAFRLYLQRDRRIGRNNRWYALDRAPNLRTVRLLRPRKEVLKKGVRLTYSATPEKGVRLTYSAAAQAASPSPKTKPDPLFGAASRKPENRPQPPAEILAQTVPQKGVRLNFSAGHATPQITKPDPLSSDAHVSERLAERWLTGSRWTAWAWTMLGSPAWRRFCGAARAMHRDLPVTRPVCWTARVGTAGCRDESWEALRPAGAQALQSWLASARGRCRTQAIEAAARLLADTLARGLMIRNIAADRLAIADSTPVAPFIYWQGIETVALRSPASAGAAAWCIGKLAGDVRGLAFITRCDRARFLRAFCRRRGCDWRKEGRSIPVDSLG